MPFEEDELTGDHPPVAPVEAPEEQEADRLIRDLLPKLSEEDERRLADRIAKDNTAGLQDRSEWESRLGEWEDAYYGRRPQKTFPWHGASNFHVPLTMMGVETYKPRLVEGVLGNSPPIIVVPSKGADERRKDLVEHFLNWQVMTELPLDKLVPESAHLFLKPGIVVA